MALAYSKDLVDRPAVSHQLMGSSSKVRKSMTPYVAVISLYKALGGVPG
jgi:hypothetical protein